MMPTVRNGCAIGANGALSGEGILTCLTSGCAKRALLDSPLSREKFCPKTNKFYLADYFTSPILYYAIPMYYGAYLIF